MAVKNKRIDSAFEKAIAEGVFPAADLVVGRGGQLCYEGQYGAARSYTCFDIASLTKPVATATIAMMLVAEGLLKLDDTVYQWLGGARLPEHRKTTVGMLLDHTAGLPDWQPYYRELPLSLVGTEAGRRMLLAECCNEPYINPPGKKTVYSDIGYILLGEILAQAGGAPLDALFAQYVARPLNLTNTFFIRSVGAPVQATARRTTTTAEQHVPTRSSGKRSKELPERHRRFAPTEDCPWRERVIHGEVHDQNAYALGGVAGHAGLFSTAADLHRFLTALVDAREGKGRWLSREVVRTFLPDARTKPAGERFVLGWNRPSKRNSASGTHFSANSIGHLGYTGCSIWADLAEDFWIVLLTNRIHPATTNQKIAAFRPQIHDLIYSELIAKG